jgi:hypothetical protein
MTASSANPFKAGDIVTCVTSGRMRFLHPGGNYKVVHVGPGCIMVLNDMGNHVHYENAHFRLHCTLEVVGEAFFD